MPVDENFFSISQLSGQLAAARDEVSVLNVQREQYEESMKKAFMRGVCALNMEAMTMFSEDERKLPWTVRSIHRPIIYF